MLHDYKRHKMKAKIVPITLDNLDAVAEVTKKYGFPRSVRWLKHLLFDPNVPEGRDRDSRGALIVSDKGEGVGIYCWTPCSVYLRQERKSAYIGALLGVDRKYSPWILDAIDMNMTEIAGRLAYGNDCATEVSYKFWSGLGIKWGPDGGDVLDNWRPGLCPLAYVLIHHPLWRVGLNDHWLATSVYWLCSPFQILIEAIRGSVTSFARLLGFGCKWRFKEEKGFSDERFMPFWNRFLAANEGLISSREPATLRWKFDESIQAKAVTLISAEWNGQIDGYILLRRNPAKGIPAADYSVCDICAVGNDVGCLNALLRVALRYCKRKLAYRLTYVGAPRDKDCWIVKKGLHRQYKLACNPFSYDCKDQEIIKAVQENKGWFFGPYDGERCMGCGRYVDL